MKFKTYKSIPFIFEIFYENPFIPLYIYIFLYIDRTIKIYDVAGSTYTLTATLQGHQGPVWEVSWAHPKYGIVLASCSFDGSILIHREIRPREWLLIYAGRNVHESSINSVSFAPHEYGLILAAASSDGRVSVLRHGEDNVWNVEYIVDNSLGVNAVSWAPYSVSSNTNGTKGWSPLRLVTGGCDHQIRFWAFTSITQTWEKEVGQPSNALKPCHTDWVRDVAWAPCIIPGIQIVASCSEDRTVIIWTENTTEGSADTGWTPALLHTFEAPVWRLSWSITGNILAVSSGDNNVTLWKQQLDKVWSQVGHVEEPTTVTNTSSAVSAGQ